MNRHTIPIAALLVLATSSSATPVRAQVLQETFDRERNGPWTVIPLGDNESETLSHDPKDMTVGSDGSVYLTTKVPIAGPPRDGAVFRVQDKELEQVGGALRQDPDSVLDTHEGLLIGTKGTAMARLGEVLRLDGDSWTPMAQEPLRSEVESMLFRDDRVWVGTKNDGVFTLEDKRYQRVGATTSEVAQGYHWEAIGQLALELEAVASDRDARVVVAGKYDTLIFRDDAWGKLGDLSGAKYDEAGAVTSVLREIKALTVSDSGVIYAGTKGLAGSAEGPDSGRLWRWQDETWTELGAPMGLRKEVKVIAAITDERIFVAGNESGLWLWDGSTMREINDGIAAVDGKRKCEALVVHGESIYAGVANAVYERPIDLSSSWRELGFFAHGEEIKAIAVDAEGTVHVGAKVGSGAGAVYRVKDSGLEAMGGDLTREAKQLRFGPDGTLYVTLGAGGGSVLWTGSAWQSILGSLTGAAAEIKQFVVLDDGTIVGATKAGAYRGTFVPEAQTLVNTPLRNLEAKALVSFAEQIYVATKVGGVFRLTDDESTDDGKAWVNDTIDLPKLEIEGMFVVDDAVFVASNRLLYRGTPDVEGRLKFAPFGNNPGKAALDGDGQVVFAGETRFTSVARDSSGRIFAGAESGLWVNEGGAREWTLYNGPGAVKSLVIVDDVLYVAVKETLAPEPEADPARRREQASLWVKSLRESSTKASADAGARTSNAKAPERNESDQDEAAQRERASSSGCAVKHAPSSSYGPLLAVLGSVWLVRRRRSQRVKGHRP